MWVCSGLVARQQCRENPSQHQALNKVDMATVGFIQINLHHSKGASVVLVRSMAYYRYRFDAGALGLQGLHQGHCGRHFKTSNPEPNLRAAITIKELEAQLMPEFRSRNVAAIVMDL